MLKHGQAFPLSVFQNTERLPRNPMPCMLHSLSRCSLFLEQEWQSAHMALEQELQMAQMTFEHRLLQIILLEHLSPHSRHRDHQNLCGRRYHLSR